ncbi:MAG: SDR family NAD(P)-dependent oxidoreductase [Clostridia bacterium]
MKALITGASSGIGRDMAKYLGEKGFDLILVARNKERLEEVKSGVKTNVEIITMDLATEENCIKLYNQVKDVDILINNAGFGTFGKFTETNLDTELEMIQTNIIAVHILTKLFLKDMVKKDKGYILNVSSIAGFLPGPLMATYYSTKAYVLRLTQSLQEELKKQESNVKISVLCPGPTATDFLSRAGVTFKAKSASSEYVAEYAIDKMLSGKKIIVPTLKIKCARLLCKIVPGTILAKVAYMIQKKREK